MSYESIQARLRLVVSPQSLGVDSWRYRRLTSPYGVEPRTYSTGWNKMGGLPTGQAFRQFYDENSKQWRQGQFQRFRMPDNDPLPWLSLGDQLQDPGQAVWAVVEQPTSGPGTVAFTIERDLQLYGDAGRKGGV